MKINRLPAKIGLLAGFVLLVIMVGFFWRSREPTYQGKTVSVWFEEYASGFSSATVCYGFSGSNLIVRTSSGTHTIRMPAFTNSAQQSVWVQQQMSPAMREGPAWAALEALGSNAVPHLVQRLHIGPIHSVYERVFTNLPGFLQRRLPSPTLKKSYRTRALLTLARLGDAASAATPALVDLLKQPDPSLRHEAIRALRRIHAGRQAINRLLLDLGAQKRYAELTETAWETGWEGSELTRLFAEMLRSPDPALRRNAMKLLERVGRDGAPALEQVTAALRDSDREVRLLAARSLLYIGTNTPPVIAALRASLQDEDVRVQSVALRALLKIAPDAVPSTADGSVKN